MTQLLNREQLLAKEELEIVKVEFDNGDYVFVRQMTGKERDAYEQSFLKKIKDKNGSIVKVEQNMENFKAKLAVSTLCDEKGVLILGFNDYEALSQNISALRLEKIVNVAQKINAITEDEKDVLLKNSDAVQEGSSSSASA